MIAIVTKNDYIIIEKLMQDKKYEEALSEIDRCMKQQTNHLVESEQETRYCFSSYIESLLYFNYYKPTKPNVKPEIDMARLYFYQGKIYQFMGDINKARDKFYEGIRWNPVSFLLRINEAYTYKDSNLEKFKEKVEATHKYIYRMKDLAQYQYYLGIYYELVKKPDIAKALFSTSYYCGNDSKELYDTLNEIKKNDDIVILKHEEVKKILDQNNINVSIDKKILNMLVEEYKRLIQKKDRKHCYELSDALYFYTYNRKFVFYDLLKSKEGVFVKVPSVMQVLTNEAMEKLNFKPSDLGFVYKSKIIKLMQIGKENLSATEKRFQGLIKIFKEKNKEVLETNKLENGKVIFQILYRELDTNDKFIFNMVNTNGFVVGVWWFVPVLSSIKEENQSLIMEMVKSIEYKSPTVDIKNSAYIKYKEGNLGEATKILKQDIKQKLLKDEKLKRDMFWIEISTTLYAAININFFRKNKIVSNEMLKRLFLNKPELVIELKEYFDNFRGKPGYDKIIEGLGTEKMLDSVLIILIEHI